LAKNSYFGFSAFACVSAKTKCAICAVGFFSMAYNENISTIVVMHYYSQSFIPFILSISKDGFAADRAFSIFANQFHSNSLSFPAFFIL
jgi:hypothetical protein